MIFLTVGTTDFDSLVEAMDRIAATVKEEVVAQVGRGVYVPQHMKYFRFAPSLDPYYRAARVVVAHGGLGTAIEVLERGLKLIGVSNPDRYDHHQDDLLRQLADDGCLLWCPDLSELDEALREVDQRTFRPYQPPECRIGRQVRRFLGLPETWE